MTGTLAPEAWRPHAEAHANRIDPYVMPHLDRRRRREPHPVHDFLFSYYSHRPAQLRRWHPGYGTRLLDAFELAGSKGYALVDGAAAVTRTHLESQVPLVEGIRALLAATAARRPHLGCFGLHEWAMVYRAEESEVRHPWPLRLGPEGTDAVVESHRIRCSHFDAYRFFTPSARPLNTLSPASTDRPAFEQPGCLHASMDLYKHAFRLSPLIGSDLVADCFELAWAVRTLDMRAAPYDLAGLGLEPVRIETQEGKQQYAAAQLDFAQRAAPLRERLIEECSRLLAEVAAA